MSEKSDDEWREEVRTHLEDQDRPIVKTWDVGIAMRVTGQNADHLYELEPAEECEYDRFQVDLRGRPTLFGYAGNGVSFDERDLGEIQAVVSHE